MNRIEKLCPCDNIAALTHCTHFHRLARVGLIDKLGSIAVFQYMLLN